MAEPAPTANQTRIDNPSVPGITSPSAALDRQLRDALDAKGSDYEPRTHHLRDDGGPVYTNRLILETSPYLLQHAHNPVNWWSWSDAAFERAAQEDKPVLLSVGYSTCHWCHVMERESFENVEIATYLNENFIAIKVDREERPDIDDLYMSAVHMLAGRGGWPMTVVMTPERQPFFGGTYFPPVDGARGARRGFLSILQELKARYIDNHDDVVAEAQQLTQRLMSASRPMPPGDVPSVTPIANGARSLARSFDPRLGGFGRAPKFPQPSRLGLMMRYHRRTRDTGALRTIAKTLNAMSDGGMYDQIGGGFHRYSTDARWLVPHFEKMLYDNAQLATVYLEGFQLTGQARYATTAKEILNYVAREMVAPGGGFYSATDADSMAPSGHREEGWFFTWTPQEVIDLVGETRGRVINTFYGVTPRGNFEGRSILHITVPRENVARRLSMNSDEFSRALASASREMYTARLDRPAPLRDDKVLTAWSGLMIEAFARGAFVLDEPRYLEVASRAADFLLENARDEAGRLMRSHIGDRARHRAYLEDYAFLIAGLLELYEASGDLRFVERAVALQSELDARFLDEVRGGYFQTADDAEELLRRDKPASDRAVPSGNSYALANLIKLAELTGDERYEQQAEALMRAFATSLSRRPMAHPKMLQALDAYHDTRREIAIVYPSRRDEAAALVAQLRRTYLPNRVAAILSAADVETQSATIPWLAGKAPIGGRATAYVCERGRCELPTSDPSVFGRQLSVVRDLSDPLPAPLAVP